MVVINLTPWQLLIWLAILVVPTLILLAVQHVRKRKAGRGLWTCWQRHPGELRGCGWTNTSTDDYCQRCGAKWAYGYGDV